jgi:hypothetical protein
MILRGTTMNDLAPIDERIDNVLKSIQELEGAFLEIQQPRTGYVLNKFVVGQHDTDEQRYAQCVLEMQIKYDNIRRAKLNKRKLEIKIAELEAKHNELDQIEADIIKIDLEEQDRAMLGALREFECLYNIWQSFPKKYSRNELDANQEQYWKLRLQRQAYQDVQSTGRIGAGNHEALRQIGMAGVPELDHVREVEKKYLEVGDIKCLIVVPTREKASSLPVLEKLEIPSGVQVKYYNVFGRNVHDAYNDAVMTALKDKADFMLSVEDDTFPPSDAFVKLMSHFRNSQNKKIILGGWYPKKTASKEGTPIILIDGKRQALPADGQMHEVYTIPMGCTLFPMSVFLATEFPYFATTDNLTQDSFFSQKARDAGYSLIVDTSIRCKHIDVATGEVYD